MNQKRLRMVAAAIFVLSASGLRSSTVWAQSNQAVCTADWDWVRSISAFSRRYHLWFLGIHMYVALFCRARIRLGKIRARLVLFWRLVAVEPVSSHGRELW